MRRALLAIVLALSVARGVLSADSVNIGVPVPVFGQSAVWICRATLSLGTQAVECQEDPLSEGCLPTKPHLHHRHHTEPASTAAFPGESADLDLPATSGGQTLSAYIQEHTETHSEDNVRLRRLMQWSAMFNTTSVAGHSKIIEWYENHDDVLFEQPISFIWETNDTKQWIPKDSEWQEIHERHAQQAGSHKVRHGALAVCFNICRCALGALHAAGADMLSISWHVYVWHIYWLAETCNLSSSYMSRFSLHLALVLHQHKHACSTVYVVQQPMSHNVSDSLSVVTASSTMPICVCLDAWLEPHGSCWDKPDYAVLLKHAQVTSRVRIM